MNTFLPSYPHCQSSLFTIPSWFSFIFIWLYSLFCLFVRDSSIFFWRYTSVVLFPLSLFQSSKILSLPYRSNTAALMLRTTQHCLYICHHKPMCVFCVLYMVLIPCSMLRCVGACLHACEPVFAHKYIWQHWRLDCINSAMLPHCHLHLSTINHCNVT